MTKTTEKSASDKQKDRGNFSLSLLFPEYETPRSPISRKTEFFKDLNLDQLIVSIAKGSEDYDLAPFYRTPCSSLTEVRNRQAIFRDLENPRLLQPIHSFIESMRRVRGNLARSKKQDTARQRESWHLEAALEYCAATLSLSNALDAESPTSQGFQNLSRFLLEYRDSESFTGLDEDGRSLKADLAALRYEVLFTGLHVDVRENESRVDYSKELERLFQRFQQGEDESLDLETLDIGSVSWVEGEILERVGLVHKEVFFRLRSYVELHTWFQNPTIILFDEEIQFFTAYLSVITPLRDAGLSFCFPSILESKKHVEARDAFDLPLALQLLLGKERPVPNDFQLEGQERVLVVTGPNQGGKTTFARMFGQLHYLGSLGCPVPGSSAHLLLPDRIFTHFEREESTSSEGGKLEDDVIRIHAILQDATEKSIFIVNEIFASTSLSDAVFLSREIVERITRLDALCVWVTFLEEIASLSPATIGYVSSVDPQDPVVRTFRILRKSSDGQTYAAALANRHRLSYEAILARMAS